MPFWTKLLRGLTTVVKTIVTTVIWIGNLCAAILAIAALVVFFVAYHH